MTKLAPEKYHCQENKKDGFRGAHSVCERDSCLTETEVDGDKANCPTGHNGKHVLQLQMRTMHAVHTCSLLTGENLCVLNTRNITVLQIPPMRN